jgi:predicted DNA-binding transcriptional regulator AlpA
MSRRISSADRAERSINPPSFYLSDKDLAARYRNSRATVWRWVQTRNFPRPIRLSPQCTRWSLNDVLQWEATQRATQ